MNNNIVASGNEMNLFIDISIFVMVFRVVVSMFDRAVFVESWIVIAEIRAIIGAVLVRAVILNFSFDAILVMYINRINIPPTIIRNRMYENHEFWFMPVVMVLIIIVCIRRTIPIERGCFINMNIIVSVMFTERIYVISGGSLIKILILEINDGKFSPLDDFKGLAYF